MSNYKETTIYRFDNGEIKYLGNEIFEIKPNKSEDFTVPYKVKKNDFNCWEVFDSEILQDNLPVPLPLTEQLNILLNEEKTRNNQILN